MALAAALEAKWKICADLTRTRSIFASHTSLCIKVSIASWASPYPFLSREYFVFPLSLSSDTVIS